MSNNDPKDFITSTVNTDGSVTLGSTIRSQRDTSSRRIALDASTGTNANRPHTINANFDVNGPAQITGSQTQPNIINGGFGRTTAFFETRVPSLNFGKVISTNNFVQTLNGGEANDRINADQVGPVSHETLNVLVTSINRLTGLPQFQATIAQGDRHNIDGRGGNDVINGGSYDDTINGGDGADTINGGASNDIIYGNGAPTAASDNFGPDVLNGGDGLDQLLGYINGAIMNGGAGNDFLSSGGGNTTMNGGDGNDVIRGADGSKDTVIMSRSGLDQAGNTRDEVRLQKEDELIIPKLPDGYTVAKIEIDVRSGFGGVSNGQVQAFTARWYGTDSAGKTELLGQSYVNSLSANDMPQIKLQLSNGGVKDITHAEIVSAPNNVFTFQESQLGNLSPGGNAAPNAGQAGKGR